jgi:hypothetical protein
MLKKKRMRIEQQKIDYETWLRKFKNQRNWIYFQNCFNKDISQNKKYKILDENDRDYLMNSMLYAIYFAKKSKYENEEQPLFKETERYKRATESEELQEALSKMLDAIKTISKIRSKNAFKRTHIEPNASSDMYSILNKLGDRTHLSLKETISDVENHPDRAVINNWGKVFEVYESAIKNEISQKHEYFFSSFHCLLFEKPIAKSKLGKRVSYKTALTIFFHNELSSMMTARKKDEYPAKNISGGPFCTLKGIGWTTPARLALSALDCLSFDNGDGGIDSSNITAVKSLVSGAKNVIKSQKNLYISGWHISFDHM